LKYPVAIIDYGIGGLGLYKLIRQDFPKLPLLYFSDSGEVPYGKLSRLRLRARLDPVDELYKSVYAELKRFKNLNGGSVFVTTGDVKLMKSAAHKAFSVKLTKIKHIVIR
jgi:glutamate racemase